MNHKHITDEKIWKLIREYMRNKLNTPAFEIGSIITNDEQVIIKFTMNNRYNTLDGSKIPIEEITLDYHEHHLTIGEYKQILRDTKLNQLIN